MIFCQLRELSVQEIFKALYWGQLSFVCYMNDITQFVEHLVYGCVPMILSSIRISLRIDKRSWVGRFILTHYMYIKTLGVVVAHYTHDERFQFLSLFC